MTPVTASPSAVFSKNIERAKALASRIETGAIWINTFASTAPELPFGGVKRSGYGRELGAQGLREFVNVKTVWIQSWKTPIVFGVARAAEAALLR